MCTVSTDPSATQVKLGRLEEALIASESPDSTARSCGREAGRTHWRLSGQDRSLRLCLTGHLITSLKTPR